METVKAFNLRVPGILSQRNFYPNFYDFFAIIFIVAMLVSIAWGAAGMNKTLAELKTTPVSLDLVNLPRYAIFTTLRMSVAIIVSLFFSLIVATLAAKNRIAGLIIIPLLDVLQSVPVLGFLAFTIAFFLNIFPGHEFGAELAAIFAIFTSQAWNMSFSLYQSFITVPIDLEKVSLQYCENARQKFWRLELPYAIPGLVWNTMMSMSAGWFFVVASEAIAVGNTQVELPGIGSWLSLAIKHKDFAAIAWAILAMSVVIIIYDQFLFRPLVVWSNKFNMSKSGSGLETKSWVYDVIKRSNFIAILRDKLIGLRYVLLCTNLAITTPNKKSKNNKFRKILNIILYILLLGAAAKLLFLIKDFFLQNTVTTFNWPEIRHVCILGVFTMLRVMSMIIIASIIWVPIGVWVGLHPTIAAWVQPLAQFLAAFPANILFPIMVVAIVYFKLNPDIWLSVLLILGTQWYIFFNVIAGTKAFPNDLQRAADIYQIRSWLWWRKIILPGIFPYYITGALTAAGGAWNASIVAEVVSWGSTKLSAHGIGAYIAQATASGDMNKVVLGVIIMSTFVVFFNQVIWRRLYAYAAKNSRYS